MVYMGMFSIKKNDLKKYFFFLLFASEKQEFFPSGRGRKGKEEEEK